MEGIPLELIEKSTSAQQEVMLEVVKYWRKNKSMENTESVWGIFAKK